MLKKAAALLLACASMVAGVGCGTTSNRYLYASIPGANEIIAFREDPNSGALIQLVGSPITAGQAVQSLAIHPSQKFLYAANSGATPTGTISLFTISNGALTEKTPRINAGTAPTLLAMDPSGTYLYVANSGSFDISVFKIDSTDGTLSVVPQTNGNTAGIGLSALNMQLSPSGNTLFVTGQSGTQGYIEEFSVTSGVLSVIQGSGTPFITGNGPYGLAIDSTGTHLYTANKIDNSISAFSIGSTGALTLISTTGETFTGPVSLFIDKSGKYLYVANQQSPGNLAAYSIGTDGSLTLLATSPFATGAQPNFIAGDSSGDYLFVGNQSTTVIQSFSLAPSTGTLTSVSTYGVPGTPTSIVITH